MTQQEARLTPTSCQRAVEDVRKNATYESNLVACSCVLITAHDSGPVDTDVFLECPKANKNPVSVVTYTTSLTSWPVSCSIYPQENSCYFRQFVCWSLDQKCDL